MSVNDLITLAGHSQGFFFKYISANDAGITGAHQAGLYMSRDVWSLFFDRPGERGENRSEWIDISWPQTNQQTRSKFLWYGKAKSEYRLTNGLSFLGAENAGDLLVLVRRSRGQFSAYLLSNDEDIDSFLEAFTLSPADAFRLQQTDAARESLLEEFCDEWLADLPADSFPDSKSFGEQAREFVRRQHGKDELTHPDEALLLWLDAEFRLFKAVERRRYAGWLHTPFDSVDQLIDTANTILNRRKARSGLALELHLCHLFTRLKKPFSYQETTEARARPDFIFPSILHYRDSTFDAAGLTFLAVKTTCKDRWRQILVEAERIPRKYLFTLQQGMSESQLLEMRTSGVRLVVPAPYRRHFPKAFRDEILSLAELIDLL